MIDIFVLGAPFFVWLAAFIGLHIAVWTGEELQYRKQMKRLHERYSRDDRHRNESDEED